MTTPLTLADLKHVINLFEGKQGVDQSRLLETPQPDFIAQLQKIVDDIDESHVAETYFLTEAQQVTLLKSLALLQRTKKQTRKNRKEPLFLAAEALQRKFPVDLISVVQGLSAKGVSENEFLLPLLRSEKMQIFIHILLGAHYLPKGTYQKLLSPKPEGLNLSEKDFYDKMATSLWALYSWVRDQKVPISQPLLDALFSHVDCAIPVLKALNAISKIRKISSAFVIETLRDSRAISRWQAYLTEGGLDKDTYEHHMGKLADAYPNTRLLRFYLIAKVLLDEGLPFDINAQRLIDSETAFSLVEKYPSLLALILNDNAGLGDASWFSMAAEDLIAAYQEDSTQVKLEEKLRAALKKSITPMLREIRKLSPDSSLKSQTLKDLKRLLDQHFPAKDTLSAKALIARKAPSGKSEETQVPLSKFQRLFSAKA